jgi:arylsulfatase A-like enzyme
LAFACNRLISLRTLTISLIAVAAASVLTVGATFARLSVWPSITSPAATKGAARPNLVVISIDTLRADHLGCYGYPRPTSPNLDALATAGARFSEAIAPSPWTLPSHMTMWTALPPAAHQVITRERRLRARVQTLAEVLRDAGYRTAAVVAGGYLRAEYGHIQGFESYDDETLHRSCGQASYRTCVTGPALLAKARRQLARLEQSATDGGPFFLLVHLWDVHGSYMPPAPYTDMFDRSYRGHRPFSEAYDALYDGQRVSDAELDHLVALYDGEIAYTDTIVGDLLESLRTSGLLDRTVVAVTADHGEEFFEHGRWGHEHNLYRESLHVPLILRFPTKIPPGTVVDRPVRLAELAPMLLALLEVQAPAGFGQSPGRLEPGLQRQPPLWTSGGNRLDPGTDIVADLKGRAISLRRGRWKLIEQLYGRSSEPSVELYDLASDLGQHVDVHARHPNVVTSLRTELKSWRAHWERRRAATAYATSTERLHDLRALGYAQ